MLLCINLHQNPDPNVIELVESEFLKKADPDQQTLNRGINQWVDPVLAKNRIQGFATQTMGDFSYSIAQIF